MANRVFGSLWILFVLAGVGIAWLFIFGSRSGRDEPETKVGRVRVLPPEISRGVESNSIVSSVNTADGTRAVSNNVSVVIPAGGTSEERRAGSPASVPTGVVDAAVSATSGSATAVTGAVGRLPLIAQYKGEPNAILRREAMLKWSQEEQPAIGEVVQVAVTDGDPSVILQALEILARRGDKASAPLLASVIRDNAIRPDGYGMPIREMAIRALGACGGGDNVPQLVAELERHEDLSYDNVVVESLGLIGHVSALDALNRQIRRLEQFKPGERMVQEVVQRALEITIAARDRIIKRGES